MTSFSQFFSCPQSTADLHLQSFIMKILLDLGCTYPDNPEPQRHKEKFDIREKN